MDLSKFVVHVGTVRGFLLSTSDKPKDIKTAKCDDGSQVTGLAFGRKPSEILIGHGNGNVNVYDTQENKYTKNISNLDGKGSVVGLECINKSILVARSDGVVNIWNKKKTNTFKMSFDEKGSLETVVLNKLRENVIGTGGEHNDFKLWDIETHQCIFRSKSLGHDYLNLPIPTSIRGITFFNEGPNLSACCTKEGHVLLYDDRVQRRPVVKFLETKASYTCIASTYRERQCLVGTTKGYMQLLDMKAGKNMKTFTSFTGSVTSIVCDPVEPYIATTSLDRHLRIHNIETKELLHKVYMKQSLTRVLMKPIIKDEPTDEPEKVDKEFEDIFDQMEVVIDCKSKKRKLAKKLESQEEIVAKISENEDDIEIEKLKARKHKTKEDNGEKIEVVKKMKRKKMTVNS